MKDTEEITALLSKNNMRMTVTISYDRNIDIFLWAFGFFRVSIFLIYRLQLTYDPFFLLNKSYIESRAYNIFGSFAYLKWVRIINKRRRSINKKSIHSITPNQTFIYCHLCSSISWVWHVLLGRVKERETEETHTNVQYIYWLLLLCAPMLHV